MAPKYEIISKAILYGNEAENGDSNLGLCAEMKSRQVVGTDCYDEPNLAVTVKRCPTFQQSTPRVSYFTPHSYWWGCFILISDRSTFSSNFTCCIFVRSTIEFFVFFFVRINNWKPWRLFLKRLLQRNCHLKQNDEEKDI